MNKKIESTKKQRYLIFIFILFIIIFSYIKISSNESNGVYLGSAETSLSCEEKIQIHCENTYPNGKYINEYRNYEACVGSGISLGACPDVGSDIGKVEAVINNKPQELHQHRVLDRVSLIKGGIYVDVLLEDISLKITRDEFSIIAKSFYKNERGDYSFYLNEEAYKANFSGKFLRENPNALKNGLLGEIKNGEVLFGSFFEGK